MTRGLAPGTEKPSLSLGVVKFIHDTEVAQGVLRSKHEHTVANKARFKLSNLSTDLKSCDPQPRGLSSEHIHGPLLPESLLKCLTKP